MDKITQKKVIEPIQATSILFMQQKLIPHNKGITFKYFAKRFTHNS
jgi:hypothetical protein